MANYTIHFGPDFERMLNEIAEEKKFPKSEVIRRAVASYQYLSGQVASGRDRKLSITDKDDHVLKDVVLP
jgi:predicted transcriptional regulator